MDSINKYAKEGIGRIFVGNKCDLEDERGVPKERAEALANSFGMNYYETSAKQNINIEECMSDIIEQTIQRKN